MSGYDVVGDVHGHAGQLVGLLDQLGYRPIDGVWRHPKRTAVFVGDLIDRGTKNVETVGIVEAMVNAGAAHIVLGNHEFNAICFATPDPADPSTHLRPRTAPWTTRPPARHDPHTNPVRHPGVTPLVVGYGTPPEDAFSSAVARLVAVLADPD